MRGRTFAEEDGICAMVLTASCLEELGAGVSTSMTVRTGGSERGLLRALEELALRILMPLGGPE